ncbi:hypothetical protein PMI22_00475 [Pseudomonas sp. GM21]|uniref:hypothetical protein n=1 Tax=Pseudomonas sp. GM21 TaxID=1144325 RepID=UPI0002722899|nr:hypothetical protein [Pseudomonas sp. GM21]EJM25129.1 hypothetical protein PMI22_00475 [Pseudomonas sp. GM21]
MPMLPLIQIQQDHPAIIDAARLQLRRMVEELSHCPDDYPLRHGYHMHATGYLDALLKHKLVSDALYEYLYEEVAAYGKHVLGRHGITLPM